MLSVKDNKLQRIKSTSHLHTVEKILPGITYFTVDWISDNVYYTDGRKIRITSLNRSLEHIDLELYQTSDDFYISTLAVDPVIGLVFYDFLFYLLLLKIKVIFILLLNA